VSLRDVKRLLEVMSWFYNQREYLYCAMNGDEDSDTDVETDTEQTETELTDERPDQVTTRVR